MKLSHRLIRKAAGTAHKDLARLRDLRRTQTPEDAETPQRLTQRLLMAREVTATPAEAQGMFERIIKGNDLTGINYLEKGLRAAKSIGRIHVLDSSGEPLGFGTGFLIAPGILMTNHHVLTSAEVAAASLIEFDYELDGSGHDRQSFTYQLRPQDFFFNHEALDFAVCAVAPTAREKKRPVKDFSWLKLNRTTGKVLLTEYLTIIQHPGGQRKQICVRENQVLRLDTDTIWYATDTLGGSSGSPAFNSSWQVVALHHLGVPQKNADGHWLTVDGGIWDESMDESRVQWIANEGIRISRIVDTLSKKFRKHPRLVPIFDTTQPPIPAGFESITLSEDPATTTPLAIPPSASGPTSVPNNPLPTTHYSVSPSSITIPLHLTLTLGPSTAAPLNVQFTSPNTPALAAPNSAPLLTEAISIDPDYTTRTGFDPAFLGKTAALKTPLPTLSAKQKADAARLTTPPAGADPLELKYHHFSVVMNAVRRLAFFTAVNVDGVAWRSITRESDRWILDPRIPKTAQAGEALYSGNPLDRGHLVRRLDPAWGASLPIAKTANDDTFHFTNCAPQHEDFNQNNDTWAGLEDYLLQNADRENLRVTVFTGPVFATSDETYRGIQLPRQFWKIAVMVSKKKLHATAYLLSQATLIKGLVEADFSYGNYKTFQVPITRIAKLTGLTFGKLPAADPLNKATESTAPRELASLTDIAL
ncbi:endonuclease [Nibricoccus aquaticus]|uniref:Serine protease n=1 Tax=Nibricoccus aquaticus TaxID=2576891 RepID=A0A290Q9K8_9BACT|nr:DNA/RNA non-specific endonuclease [Nibricoccus aquaticus]ATC63880.1 endonuclease [Nibricoccus aquaticus]